MRSRRGSTRCVRSSLKFPMIAALKTLLAHFSGADAWATVRPPLVALDAGQRAALLAGLPAGFAISGL